MTTKSDFLKQGTLVFSCGLNSRDATRGYARETPVENTQLMSLLTSPQKQPPVKQAEAER